MNLIHTLSDLALRYLSEEKFDFLRSVYLKLDGLASPLLKKMHGTYSAEDLRVHLEQTIGKDFEILMVHGSVNHMLPMYKGTALELVNMLIDYCGPTKTLVMPAFFFGDPKIGNVQQTFQTNPVCNLKRHPSQMGIMTEIFRRTKGVLQSRHPVYRVAAIGPLAESLTIGHENASGPAGIGSPFEFMAKHDTMVIGIGKSFHVMTQVHHVDELMGEDFPVPRLPQDERNEIAVTVVDGNISVPVKLRDNGIRWRFNIAKLPSLLKQGDLRLWKFHNTPLFAGRAKKVTTSLIESAQKGQTLYDPN
jgi:aminoglycoside 3-N-acetyltransferase